MSETKTPDWADEIADSIVRRGMTDPFFGTGKSFIAAALRSERERCATWAQILADDEGGSREQHATAQDILDRIRAGDQP